MKKFQSDKTPKSSWTVSLKASGEVWSSRISWNAIKLKKIEKISSMEELPEFLTDESEEVREAAKRKLDEISY